MKKFALVTILATAIALTFGSVAYANFGPHGGYEQDTDACAGCHRAHTSASSVQWVDNGGEDHSALLVSSATSMSQFCYACHGDGAPGASTNVLTGVFDAGPSGAVGQNLGDSNGGVGVIYRTNSTAGAGLNGGSFSGTSMHDMDLGAATDPVWGAGNSAPTGGNLTCTGCHDPHGSSNYRLLKDNLGANRVGGYTAADEPTPWVISDEEGYPVSFPNPGWKKHGDGAAQMAAYKPNYTSEELGYIGGHTYNDGDANAVKSLSAWCAGCHEAYDNTTSTYDYGNAEAAKSNGAITMGARTRHRHPVNVPITGAALTVSTTTSTVLPLEVPRSELGEHRGTWEKDNYLGCVTCHRAHGSSATMTGWAEAALDTSATAVVTWFPVLDPASGGVNPNKSAALLRADNRGVCERCHNK